METNKDEVQCKIAEVISSFLRSFSNKQQRMDYLNRLPQQPTAAILKIINQVAELKQDYETCEALKIYCEERGIELSH